MRSLYTTIFLRFVKFPLQKTSTRFIIFCKNNSQIYFSERNVKPEEIGLEEPRGVVSEGKQPFLVAFFKSGPKLGSSDAGARRKREARRWRTNGYSENYLRNPLTGEFS